MDEPGRSCPVSYRTRPEDLGTAPQVDAETAYVVGGLYGNVPALKALLALREQEVAAGLPRPALIFNGDFNWFNAEASAFSFVNATVLEHQAVPGNVEMELCDPQPGAGCGCAYPEWVDADTVEYSNRIMRRLQAVASQHPAVLRRISALPKMLRLRVSSLDVGILHGDPESLSGWGLALENLPTPGTTSARIAHWFRAAEADVLACSHTCLPYAQDFHVDNSRRAIFNNGAAGMPNFRGDRRGVITRISLHAGPEQPLYGCRIDGAHCEAVALPWDTQAWDRWFSAVWPRGSAASASYRERLQYGPRHRMQMARRLHGRVMPDRRHPVYGSRRT